MLFVCHAQCKLFKICLSTGLNSFFCTIKMKWSVSAHRSILTSWTIRRASTTTLALQTHSIPLSWPTTPCCWWGTAAARQLGRSTGLSRTAGAPVGERKATSEFAGEPTSVPLRALQSQQTPFLSCRSWKCGIGLTGILIMSFRFANLGYF